MLLIVCRENRIIRVVSDTRRVNGGVRRFERHVHPAAHGSVDFVGWFDPVLVSIQP
jgi:hypothetical protein